MVTADLLQRSRTVLASCRRGKGAGCTTFVVTVISVWPERLFDSHRSDRVVYLADADGPVRRLETGRWHAPVGSVDLRVLERVQEPVLDVGCGPGRHVAELTTRGLDAVGIDCSPAAVLEARGRGAHAIQASVFDDVVRCGEWATVLLLDGNIGIGGDPVRLLGRCAQLMRPGGQILVETEPPGTTERRGRFRVMTSSAGPGRSLGHMGQWFHWALVSSEQNVRIAASAGLSLSDTWSDRGRWFAELSDCPRRLR